MVAITFEQKDRQTRQKTLKIREDLPTEHTENAKVFQKFFGSFRVFRGQQIQLVVAEAGRLWKCELLVRDEYGLAGICLFKTLPGARDFDAGLCDCQHVDDHGPTGGDTEDHQRSHSWAS